MEFYGKVKEILEPISGQNVSGEWKRQTIVVESFDNPMNCIALDALNDRIALIANLQVGMAVKATFGVNSRKGEKGYFTSASLWDIQKL